MRRRHTARAGYGELARRLHNTALMRDYLGMEPTVSDSHGAGDGEHAQLAAEPSQQAALTPAAGESVAAKDPQAPAGSVASGITGTLARLPRARPGQVARGLAGTIGRLPGPRALTTRAGRIGRLPAPQPGRLGRWAADGVSRLQRLLPGRLGRWAADRVSRLQRLRSGRLARGIAGLWRQHPVEATSLTLLALAGLAYPFPFWWLDFAIWLIGAAIAAWSQTWDLKDKWAGLAGPVVLVIVGTAAMLVLGGARATMTGYVHEALTVSLYLIKTGSLLGAAYLAWRVQRGPRSPSVPPWLREKRS
jgi:hypothetical protein